ncbi:MAG: colicin production protein [Bacteroidetes bacterium]|nr:colicin production protein [Bacteroidota bacterium]
MIFDILFLIFIGGGFYWGYQKGIIYSVFSLLAFFIGIIVALKFSYVAVKFLNGMIHLSPKAMSVVSFIVVFILIVLLVRLIAWGLEQILKSMSLNLTNQLIGGVIYSLIGLYALCVCIWFLNKWNVFPDSQKVSSHVYPYISDTGPKVVEYSGQIVPFFKNAFHDLDQLIKGA